MTDVVTPADVAPQTLDLELVRRVQRGDSTAFDLLVRKYQHRIVALIGRYIHDWSECQDVAQDTFVRAYRAIGNFRGDAQFYTWLHRIAVNTAKNHLVAHKRRPPTDDVDAADAERRRRDAQSLAESLQLPIGNAVDFWTEASLFSAGGYTALVYGPGDIAQAHTADEFVTLAQLQGYADAVDAIINGAR